MPDEIWPGKVSARGDDSHRRGVQSTQPIADTQQAIRNEAIRTLGPVRGMQRGTWMTHRWLTAGSVLVP